MIKWKFNLIIIFYFILFFVSCQDEDEDDIDYKEIDSNYSLEVGKIKFRDLKLQNKYIYNFSDQIKDDLLVNFYSPNCNIELDDDDINKDTTLLISNENIISFEIKKQSLKTFNISIKSKLYLTNSYQKKYKKLKMCPLIINSIGLKNSQLSFKKNVPIFLLFYENLKQINVSYKIDKLKEKPNRSLTLSFSLNNVSEFNIYIPNIINTTISNSTTIFIDTDSLKNIQSNSLEITITYIGNKNTSLIFQIIKQKSFYLLQKNNLNKGFITSNFLRQYYYVKVLEEEGEIMLHNKRNNGKLLGIIKNKEYVDPENKENYIQRKKDNQLEFDEHSQKLSFNYEHTKNCSKGCYLFITYYNENYNKSENKSITGHEYTLLVRTWNVEDDTPQIINVPLNEYIFGTFNEDSLINHYYSIFIPQEIKKIIIQIESNYIEGYIGKGKRKLITSKKKNTNLNITQNKMIIELSKDKLNELEYLNDEISLAFRPTTFFSDIFSFYYFRIFISTESDTNLIYPLDSNIENICIPERDKNNEDNYFYCYFLLKNTYNEFNQNFYVTTSNQNDMYKIYSFHNYKEKNNNYSKYYISDKNDKDLKLILFKFQFNDNKIKTILSSFSNELDLTYPQIYSSQIFYISNNKAFRFGLKYKYLLEFSQIYGNGYARIARLDNSKLSKIGSNNNFKGKLISIPLSNIHNITFYPKNELLFYFKLDYLAGKEKISKILYGQSMNELLLDINFPIYYYIEYNNQDNIDINFRIINVKGKNKTSDIFINGYILNKDNMERQKRGEFIELKDPIIGRYDKWSKIGILQINKTIINKYFKENNIKSEKNNQIDKKDYVLIKIDGKHYTRYSMSNEIIAISKENQNYLIPINQYIIGYSNSLNNISYLIRNEKNINDEMIIEFSPNYKDIELLFDDSMKNYFKKLDSETGTQKYKIQNNINFEKIILNVNTHNKSDGNYLLRYYFTNNETLKDEFEYKLDKLCDKKKRDLGNDNYDFSFIFNKFEIYLNKELIDGKSKTINLQIYGSLFSGEINNQEILNSSAIISSIPIYENQTEVIYRNNTGFELYFCNISKTYKKYNLQIKINIKINDYFFNEKFIVYSVPIDLSEEFKEDLTKFLKKYYVLIISISTIIIIALIFIILYFKLKKKNEKFKKGVLAISFASENNDDIIEDTDPITKNSINPFI